MTKAIIYQPTKNAMQSGKAKTKIWLLEFPRSLPMKPDALMGWTTMSETIPQQLQLKFETREDAIAYAEARGIVYELREPKVAQVGGKAYAENFAFGKRKAFSGNC
jgi:hypothetical protein